MVESRSNRLPHGKLCRPTIVTWILGFFTMVLLLATVCCAEGCVYAVPAMQQRQCMKRVASGTLDLYLGRRPTWPRRAVRSDFFENAIANRRCAEKSKAEKTNYDFCKISTQEGYYYIELQEDAKPCTAIP